MYRRGGIAVILAGLGLGILFLFWPLQYQTGWVRSRSDVTKVYVACGTPSTILFGGEFSDEARTPWIQEQCVRAARTRVVNVVVFSIPLVILGGAAFGRGRYRRVPLADVLRPLPKLHWWRRRSNLGVRSPDVDEPEDALEVDARGERPERPAPP